MTIRHIIREQMEIEAAVPAWLASMGGAAVAVGLRFALKKVLQSAMKAMAKQAAKKAAQQGAKKITQKGAQKVLMNPKVIKPAMRRKIAQKGISDSEIDEVIKNMDSSVGEKAQKLVFSYLVEKGTANKTLTEQDVADLKAGKAPKGTTSPTASGKKGKNGEKPPKGYEKVKSSKKNAYRRKKDDGTYDYWYPSKK